MGRCSIIPIFFICYILFIQCSSGSSGMFLQERLTPVRGRMSVAPLCWLEQNNPFGFLGASAQQDLSFHCHYFFFSFPENVISACFCQSTGVLCSLEWGSGPFKKTDKWQARRHQCVCGPERDVCGGIYLWTI